jgi:hypothetical protein
MAPGQQIPDKFTKTMSEQITKAKAVKQRYEKKWLSMRGVTAVGLGQVNGKTGIIISVEQNVDKVRAQIPSYVEGIPVKVQFSGMLKAQ